MRRHDLTPPRSASTAESGRSTSSKRVVRSALEVLAEASPPPLPALPLEGPRAPAPFATVTTTRNNSVQRVAPAAIGATRTIPTTAEPHTLSQTSPLFPSPDRSVLRQPFLDEISTLSDATNPMEGYITVAEHKSKLKACLEAYDERRDEEERSVLRSVGKEVEDLSARNDHLAITIEELTQQKSSLSSTVDRLKAHCEVLTQTVRELHAELQSERDRSARLDVALCHAEDKCRLQASQMTQELDFEKAQFAVATSELRAQHENERRQLEDELSHRRAEVKELTEALKELRHAHEARTQDDEGRAGRISSLQRELAAASGQHETAQRLIDSLRQAMDEKDLSLKKLAARAAQLERSAAEKEQARSGALSSSSEKIRSLEDQLKAQGDDLRKKLGRISALEAEVKQKEEANAGLRSELASRDERHATLHQAAEALARSAARLVKRVENEFPSASDAVRDALDTSLCTGESAQHPAGQPAGKKRQPAALNGKPQIAKQAPPPFFVVGSNPLQLLAHAQSLVDVAHGTIKDCGRAMRLAVQRCQELQAEQTEAQRALEVADDVTRREAVVVVQRLQQDREDLRRQVGVLEAQLANADRELSRLKSSYDASEVSTADLRQQVRSAQQLLQETEADRDALRRQVRSLSDELEATSSKHQQQRERADKAEASLEASIKEASQNQASATAAESAAAMARQMLTEEKERQGRVAAGLRLEVKRLTKELQESRNELAAATHSKAGRIAVSAAAEKEVLSLRRSLELAKSETDGLQASHQTMQADLHNKAAELVSVKKQLRAAEASIDKYKRRANDAREASLQAVMSLSATAQSCIETLSNAIAVWNATPSRKPLKRDATVTSVGTAVAIPFSVTDAVLQGPPSSLEATMVELSPADGGVTPDPQLQRRLEGGSEGVSTRPVIDRLVATCQTAANVVLAAHKEALGHQRELARRDELVAFLDAERRVLHSPGNIVSVQDASPAAIVHRSTNRSGTYRQQSLGSNSGSASPPAPRWSSSSAQPANPSDEHSPIPIMPAPHAKSHVGPRAAASQQSSVSHARGHGLSASSARHADSTTRSLDGNSSPSKPPVLRSSSASSSDVRIGTQPSNGVSKQVRRRAEDLEPHNLVSACA